MTREQEIIQNQTQALKDIINASRNHPYSALDLEDFFSGVYQAGVNYLVENEIEEIA